MLLKVLVGVDGKPLKIDLWRDGQTFSVTLAPKITDLRLRFGVRRDTEYVELVAPFKTHILVEKPFAASLKDADAMIAAAKKYPDVKFEHATGYKLAPNVGVYDHRVYQDAYISGMIAGATTKTDTLGFVGTFPIPEVLRNINAYTLGAQAVNPKVKTKVVWIGTWFDPPKEAEAAQSLINAGADVLFQNTDSSAVLQTAEKNNKYAFGWDSDMSAVAPKAHLASNMIYWGPYYKKAVKDVLDGTWKSERSVWGYKEGTNAVIKIADSVPEDVKKKIEEVQEGLKAGTFDPFKGPIVDTEGKERLPKDQLPDQAWKDQVDFYVKGVEGKVPSGGEESKGAGEGRHRGSLLEEAPRPRTTSPSRKR